MEKLSPTERAAYILRESFDYPYAEIADILQLSQANARQLVSRARKHLAAVHRAPVSPADHRRLLQAFLTAAQTGNLGGLEAVLAADVVSYTDGGGVVQAARIPVLGRSRVAAFIRAFQPRFWPGTSIEWVEANGQPAVLIIAGETPRALLSVSVSDDGIDQIRWVMNPAKLDAYARSRTGLTSPGAAAS
jgi:RNA polymerase sigma-70 factor (ECF subfamily)